MKKKQNNKDYYVGTYHYKKPRKQKLGKICPICKACKNRTLCKNRKDTKLMKKCPECKECYNKELCDTFYIGIEHRASTNVGFDEDGKAIRRTFNANSSEEATYMAVKYRHDVKNGIIQPKKQKSKHSILTIYKEYIENRLSTGEISECTYLTHQYTISRIENEVWANKPIKEVTRNQIEDFLARERLAGLSNSILKKDFSLIRASIEIAVERGYIPQTQNYFLGRYGIKKPKSLKKDKKVKSLELNDQIKFLNYLYHSDIPHRDLFILSMNTGVRIGELLALKLEDIHLDENYFWIKRSITKDKEGRTIIGENTKTENGERKIVLNEITKPVLERAIQNKKPSKENLIFCKENGDVYTDGAINSALKRAFKNAGFNNAIHTHMLRHTFITRSKEAGVDVEATKTGVGHSDIHITQDVYNEDQLPYLLKQNQTYSNYIKEKLDNYKETFSNNNTKD